MDATAATTAASAETLAVHAPRRSLVAPRVAAAALCLCLASALTGCNDSGGDSDGDMRSAALKTHHHHHDTTGTADTDPAATNPRSPVSGTTTDPGPDPGTTPVSRGLFICPSDAEIQAALNDSRWVRNKQVAPAQGCAWLIPGDALGPIAGIAVIHPPLDNDGHQQPLGWWVNNLGADPNDITAAQDKFGAGSFYWGGDSCTLYALAPDGKVMSVATGAVGKGTCADDAAVASLIIDQ